MNPKRLPRLPFAGTLLATFATLGALLPSTAAPGTPKGPRRPVDKPNLIFIMADDLGYGDVGCYGQKEIRTPNIDRLAREGLRFTQAYAGSTVCAPSRCVLMTGLHTGHSVVRGNREIKPEGQTPLPEGATTLGTVLKSVGYATGATGKWGLGFPGSSGEPHKQGFDFFYGYNCQRQAHNYYPEHLWHNGEKVILEGNLGGKEGQYSHDLIAAQSLQFIRKHRDRPFFLYVPFTIPHTRFQVPDLGQYSDRPWTPQQKMQAAMISRMDGDVGRILNLLKELSLDDNTLVIFTSDNGPHGDAGTLQHFRAAGPLRGKKRDMYEGGVRVPFIARWPGKIRAGAVSEHVTAFQDILPTFAELAGAPAPQKIDGHSLVPALLGRPGQKQHPYLYWELYEQGGKQGIRVLDDPAHAWKGVRLQVSRDRNAPIELYDLKTDPAEERNVAAEHPEVVARIAKLMDEAHRPSELWTWAPRQQR